jgi:hypothetical protein
LLGKYHAPFDFPHSFYLHFGFSGQDRGLEKSITWENLDPRNDNVIPSNLVGFEEDDIVIAEFFATLGIDTVDWHMITENSHIPSHHDAAPASDSPAVSRVGQRKECLQRQREFSRKSELHDNDCFEAGTWGGFNSNNSNIGRSRISAIVNGSSANPNFRNNPGAGAGPGGGSAGGGGSGGTSPDTSAGGSNGDNGNGSGGGAPDTGGGAGTDTGGGEVGGGGSEVQPVPEPGTLVLLLLGFACVYYTRSQRG